MRAGETNMLTINAAPWSVPLGGRGIVQPVLFDIQQNTDSCTGQVIDGFANPSFAPAEVTAVSSPAPITPVAINFATTAAPAGNTFSYKLEPLTGPMNGSAVVNADGTATYTPNFGFAGYDSFWVRMTDAQGRSIVREQVVKVGAPVTPKPYAIGKTGLIIDRSKVLVSAMGHTIQVPLYLAPNASCDTVEGCIKYHVTFKVTVDNCLSLLQLLQC